MVTRLVHFVTVVVARKRPTAIRSAIAHEGAIDARPVLTSVHIASTGGEPRLLVTPALHLILPIGTLPHSVASC